MVTVPDGAPVAVPGTAPDPGQDPSPGRAPRLRTLDALRFAAAAGVVLYHFTARWSTVWGRDPGETFPVLGNVALYFSLAPELFFVLSGFVILWTAWGRTVPQVVASRVARLYPAYWAALALTSVLLLVLWPEGKDVSPGEVAVNTTLLQALFDVRHVDGVYWTLWAELRFYVLVVLLVWLGLTRRRVVAFATLWPVLATVAHRQDWDTLSMVLIDGYAPFFAGGMALFLVWRDGHRPVTWAVVALNVVLGVTGVGLGKQATLEQVTVFEPNPWVLGAVTVACFAAVAVATLTPVSRLDLRWFSTVGALTYPVYLVHLFWGWWVISLLSDHLAPWLTLTIAVAVSLGLAMVIHHGVERPLNRPMRRAVERGLRAVAAVLSPDPRAGQGSGIPPTAPGGSVPAATASQKAGDASGSSRTVEPTSPGR
jgi:peptidoglycan/LPS O-acetylase OafA/YrhL